MGQWDLLQYGDVRTSCKKSAMPFRSGHLNPQASKKCMTSSRGPWYTLWPSDRRMTSSNRLKVSGAGCRSETTTVLSINRVNWPKVFTMEYVVELSSPVEISSMKSAVHGPTIISPALLIQKKSLILCNFTLTPWLTIKTYQQPEQN